MGWGRSHLLQSIVFRLRPLGRLPELSDRRRDVDCGQLKEGTQHTHAALNLQTPAPETQLMERFKGRSASAVPEGMPEGLRFCSLISPKNSSDPCGRSQCRQDNLDGPNVPRKASVSRTTSSVPCACRDQQLSASRSLLLISPLSSSILVYPRRSSSCLLLDGARRRVWAVGTRTRTRSADGCGAKGCGQPAAARWMCARAGWSRALAGPSGGTQPRPV